MTADQRIFLRRHQQAFSDLVPGDPVAVRRATVRAGHAIGISGREMARWFRVSESAVSADIAGYDPRKGFVYHWRLTLRRVERARVALRLAEGAERAAVERARLRGWELAI